MKYLTLTILALELNVAFAMFCATPNFNDDSSEERAKRRQRILRLERKSSQTKKIDEMETRRISRRRSEEVMYTRYLIEKRADDLFWNGKDLGFSQDEIDDAQDVAQDYTTFGIVDDDENYRASQIPDHKTTSGFKYKWKLKRYKATHVQEGHMLKKYKALRPVVTSEGDEPVLPPKELDDELQQAHTNKLELARRASELKKQRVREEKERLMAKQEKDRLDEISRAKKCIAEKERLEKEEAEAKLEAARREKERIDKIWQQQGSHPRKGRLQPEKCVTPHEEAFGYDDAEPQASDEVCSR